MRRNRQTALSSSIAVACALGLAVALTSGGATAGSQANVALVVGVAGHGHNFTWDRTAFALGGRADLLLGRTRDADGAIGPYLEVGSTDGFHDAYVGAGIEALAPVHPYLPLVFSLGGRAAWPSGGRSSGAVSGAIFWGSRSYNYGSTYGLAAGLFVEGSYLLGPDHETSCVAGAQIDTMLLALPVILLVEALRGR